MSIPETKFRELYPRQDQVARDIVAMLYRKERRLRGLYRKAQESQHGHRDFLVTVSLANWTQAHHAAISARRLLAGKEGAVRPQNQIPR